MAKHIFRDQTVTNGQEIKWDDLAGLDASYTLIPYVSLKNVSSGEANAINRRSTKFEILLSGFTSAPVICDIEVDVGYPSEISQEMTLNDMIDRFLLYVGNPGENIFNPQDVVKTLNDTIRRLLNRLPAYYFPELQVFLTEETVDASGDYNISTFDYSPFGGILGLVRFIDGVKINGGRNCEYLSDLEKKQNTKESASYVYIPSNPKWYDKSDDTLHVEPYEASTTELDFHYQRNSYMLLLPDADNNVNCDLNAKWHSIITGFACEIYVDGYLLDGKIIKAPQAKRAYNQALNDIIEIKKYMPERNIDALDLGFNNVNAGGGLVSIYTRGRV